MVQRLLVSISTLFLAFASQSLLALGLGEVNLISKLNQPLEAEVQLLEVRDLSESEILIGLASREDFIRIGVERPYFLSDLTFKVDMNGKNGPKVVVKSRKLVREPFLNFVLQAQWPSGKVLREYTLLLDLPVFSQARPSEVNVSRSTQNTQAGAISRPANNRPTPTYSQPNASQPSYQGNSIAVQPNQTLWEIALKVRPTKQQSIQQTMLAIQRLNPDAFINNNINLLKKGQVLRVPTGDEIRQFSQREAVSNVAAQNAQWQDSSSEFGAQLSGRSNDSVAQSVSRSPEGRLKLLTPDDTRDSSAGKSSGGGDSQKQALESELAVTLEQLEKTERDNSDLRSKVESLEEQIETMERLIDVTNEDMRALELSAIKNQENQANIDEMVDDAAELAVKEASDLLDISEPANAMLDSVDTSIDGMADSVDSTIDDTAVVEEEPIVDPIVKEEPKKIAPPVKPVQKSKSILDIVMDYIVYIGIGLVLLIGGLVYWIQSRAHSDFDDDEDDFLAEVEASLSDEPDSSEDELASTYDDSTVIKDFASEKQADAPVIAQPTTGAQTGDAAAESEIYISLGQYDKAEEILTEALATDPGDIGARFKLLEVHAAQNNIEKFDENYAVIYAKSDAETIDRAAALRASIDNVPEFDEDKYNGIAGVAGAIAAVGAGVGLSALSSGSEADNASEAEISLDELPSVDDDLSLDFDLGVDESTELDDISLEMPAVDNDTLPDADLDIDIDLDIESDIDLSSKSVDEDLSLDDLELAVEDNSVDEIEFDLEDTLDLEDVPAFDKETVEQGLDDIKDDVAADIDDLELPSLDSMPNNLSAESVSDELGDLDFDLGESDSESDVTSSAADISLEDDIAALDAELDLDDIGVIEAVSSDSDSGLIDDSIALDDELDLGLDEEIPDLSVSLDSAPSADDFDDLDDLDGLDLGAASSVADLDELDLDVDSTTSDAQNSVHEAMRSMEGELEEVASTLQDAAPEEEEATELTNKMEEPVTDFDEFEELDDIVEVSEASLEADIEVGDDTLFKQAISEVSEEDIDLDLGDLESDGDDLSFMNDSDEIATKLDLARAYIDMGDRDGARDIIEEIQKEGNDQQKGEADTLLARLTD